MPNPLDALDPDDRVDLIYLGSRLGAHVLAAWLIRRHAPPRNGRGLKGRRARLRATDRIHQDIARVFDRLRATGPLERAP